MGFSGSPAGKESTYKAGDPGSIPGLGRFPGEEHGNPLQYPCQENPVGREAWQATVQDLDMTEHTHTGTFHHLDATILISAIIRLPPALLVNTFKLTCFIHII